MEYLKKAIYTAGIAAILTFSSGCIKKLNFPYTEGIYHIGIEKGEDGKNHLYVRPEEPERRQDPNTGKEKSTKELAQEDLDTLLDVIERAHIKPAKKKIEEQKNRVEHYRNKSKEDYDRLKKKDEGR